MRSLKLLLRRDWEKSRFGRHQPEGDDEADEDQVWRSHRYEMWINRLIRWSVLQDLVRVLPQNWFIHLRGHRLLSGFFTCTSSPSLSLSIILTLSLTISLSFFLSRPIFLSLLSFAHTGSLSLTVKPFLRNRSYDSNGQIPLQKDRSFTEETLWGHFTIKQPSLLWFYKVYVQVN